MTGTKALREKRALVVGEIRKMADLLRAESRDFNAEEKGKWEKLNADCDSFGNQIQAIERAMSLSDDEPPVSGPGLREKQSTSGGDDDEDGQRRDSVPTPEERELGLRCWMAQGSRKAAAAYDERAQRAAKKCGIDLGSREISIKLMGSRALADFRRNLGREARAQATTSAGAGGAMVPQNFMAELEKALLFFGGMRQAARVVRTADGATMPWPRYNDTAQTGVILAENATVANQDVTFSAQNFAAYKYSSKQVLVSSELMQDAAFDLDAEVGAILAERIGRITNTHFTTGTGSSQPMGVVGSGVGSTLGKTTAGATAITFNEIIDLMHSVDPAYRRSPSSAFMMSDGILSKVRQLTDANGYLWKPSETTNDPDTILGQRLIVNNDMVGLTAGAIVTATKTIVYGDFSKYIIREVDDLRLIRLNERYADADQVGFLAFLRCDGQVLNAGTNPLKHLLQA